LVGPVSPDSISFHPGYACYWPELDVDLAVESIRHPEKFPLVSKVRPRELR
jgi:hypothetical protein